MNNIINYPNLNKTKVLIQISNLYNNIINIYKIKSINHPLYHNYFSIIII